MNKKMVLGMWHRPFETNLEEVKETLSSLRDLGFQTLFIETYFNGQLIYPSQICFLPMHHFVGDYGPYGKHLLRAFIEEGRTLGMTIHAWVENFFVGRYDHVEDSYWYQQHKDWLLINRDGTYLQKNEVNYLFLDPAHHDVREYTLRLYQEMVNIEGLASLHLDYIRYPLVYAIKAPDISDDVGYTPSLMQSFIDAYGVKGNLVEQLTDEVIYHTWCMHKQMIITSFVEEVYTIASLHQIPLSIAIFGDPQHAKMHKMQAWDRWIEKGWIDLIIPMAYYRESRRVFEEVKRLFLIVDGRAKVYAGIAPAFMGLDQDEHRRQMDCSKEASAEGIVLFATQHYLTHSFMGYRPDNSIWHAWFQPWISED